MDGAREATGAGGAPRSDVPLPRDYDRAFLREGMAGLFSFLPVERRIVDAFARLYRRHHPSDVDPVGAYRIPPVLHQIWLGGRPLPPRFRDFRARWLELHPGWEHRLWTDADVADLDFESRDLFDSTDEVGMRSDILRAEILHRFGGVYADVDYECLRPLDRFARGYDFFGTLRAGVGAFVIFPRVYGSPVLVCNSLWGAVPGHPVAADYLAKVRRLWSRREDVSLRRREGFAAGRYGVDLLRAKRTAKITYLPFNTTVRRGLLAGRGAGRAVVLPPSYFNPVDTWWGPRRFLSPVFWLGMWFHASRGGRGLPPHYVEPFPHSYAIHHSSASWI